MDRWSGDYGASLMNHTTGLLCSIGLWLAILSFFIWMQPSVVFAKTTSITEREIIETLTELKQGQKALHQRFDDFNRRIDDVNRRIDDVNRRIDDLHKTMLAIFTILFGFMVWDRYAMVKPIRKKLEDVREELEFNHPDGSKMSRLLKALRERAREDRKLAAVLRSFTLM